jgi:hypothetical protein
MIAGVDSLALEIVPGELKLVGECGEAELLAAGLTLMMSTAPDDVWQAQVAVLITVYEVKLLPTASERAARWPEPLNTAMAVLPEDVRHEAARLLRLARTEGW